MSDLAKVAVDVDAEVANDGDATARKTQDSCKSMMMMKISLLMMMTTMMMMTMIRMIRTVSMLSSSLVTTTCLTLPTKVLGGHTT